MSLRDQILECKDKSLQSETIEVPQWGATIEVREMTGRQRASFLKKVTDKKGNMDTEKFYPQIVIDSSYDPETHEKIFKDGDFDVIAEMGSTALEIIAAVAVRLSGLNQAEAEKNLGNIPSESSTSD